MANFSYTQNGITFNNLDNAPKPIKKVPGKIFNSNNDYEYATDGIEMTIDAVTIDWNAANLGNYVNIDANGGKSNGNSAEINTTGALLSYISALAQRIDDLATAI